MAATAGWDHQPLESTSAHRAPPLPRSRSAFPRVVDDWEDDDNADDADDEVPPDPRTNQRIWENANAASPMPNVILTHSHSAPRPPAAAIQPTLRILKRPTPVRGNSAGQRTPPAAQGETLEERDARYQAARARIFGSADDSPGRSEAKDGRDGVGKGRERREREEKGGGVVRHPRGPERSSSSSPQQTQTPMSTAKGFKPRSAPPPPPSPKTAT